MSTNNMKRAVLLILASLMLTSLSFAEPKLYTEDDLSNFSSKPSANWKPNSISWYAVRDAENRVKGIKHEIASVLYDQRKSEVALCSSPGQRVPVVSGEGYIIGSIYVEGDPAAEAACRASHEALSNTLEMKLPRLREALLQAEEEYNSIKKAFDDNEKNKIIDK